MNRRAAPGFGTARFVAFGTDGFVQPNFGVHACSPISLTANVRTSLRALGACFSKPARWVHMQALALCSLVTTSVTAEGPSRLPSLWGPLCRGPFFLTPLAQLVLPRGVSRRACSHTPAKPGGEKRCPGVVPTSSLGPHGKLESGWPAGIFSISQMSKPRPRELA